jgi:putative flippase GtrA
MKKFIVVAFTCFIACRGLAQNGEGETGPYHKFAVYAGVGPSYFFNNLLTFKNQVNSLGYAFSARVMWEPQHSFLSLGIETGYFRLYTASGTISDSISGQQSNVHVSNSSIPIQFVVSMKFSKQFYADWAMGQSITFNEVSASGITTNHNATTWSLADFTATIGYRFIQKSRISYAAELKGFYSSSYANSTIAAVFIVGYRL